jgi:hypothetical protein
LGRLILRFVSIALLLFSTAVAIARLNDVHGGVVPEVEKTYVFPEQLVINSEGIFVKIDDQWHQSRALFYDQGGIFIHNPGRDGCRERFAPCRNCDRCISEGYDICPFCGQPA